MNVNWYIFYKTHSNNILIISSVHLYSLSVINEKFSKINIKVLLNTDENDTVNLTENIKTKLENNL